MNSKIVRQS